MRRPSEDQSVERLSRPTTFFVRRPRYWLITARYGVIKSVSAAVPTPKASFWPSGDHVGSLSDSLWRGSAAGTFFEPAELIEKTMEVARLLASKSPVALSGAKAACNRALQGAHQTNLDAEADSFGALFASEDAKEGMTAFVEKREANFVGR